MPCSRRRAAGPWGEPRTGGGTTRPRAHPLRGDRPGAPFDLRRYFRSSLGDGRPKRITTDAVPMQKAPAPLFQMTSAAKPPAMLEMQAPCRTLADLCESFFRQVASTLALCSRTSGHRFHLLFPLAVGCRLCHFGRQQFCCPSIRSFPAETPTKLVPRLPRCHSHSRADRLDATLSAKVTGIAVCASSARNGPNSAQTDNILSAECVAGSPLDYRDVLHASIDLIRRRKGNRWLASADAGAFHHVQRPSALISKSARGSLTEEVTATCPAK